MSAALRRLHNVGGTTPAAPCLMRSKRKRARTFRKRSVSPANVNVRKKKIEGTQRLHNRCTTVAQPLHNGTYAFDLNVPWVHVFCGCRRKVQGARRKVQGARCKV
jgi:hypothetical protein